MLNDPIFLLAAAAGLVVVVILAVGVISFARGGEFNRRNSNRFMRWRIYVQFIALALIVLFAWLHSRG